MSKSKDVSKEFLSENGKKEQIHPVSNGASIRNNAMSISSKESNAMSRLNSTAQSHAVDVDSIGSAGSIMFDKKVKHNPNKVNSSSMGSSNTDLDDEILVGEEKELHFVCRSGNLDSVKRLIKSGVEINCRNKHDRIPLHWAAGNGHLEIMKVLLNEGASIDAADKFGMDSLLWSAWFGKKHSIQHLLHAGAKSSSRNKHGSTWIHCAVQNNHLNVVQLLSEEMEDFDKDAVDDSGRTALNIACKNGQTEIVNYLLKIGCRSDLKDKLGNTPLHIAASHGKFELVSLLVNASCNIDDVNKDQLTPLHIAAREGHLECCQELIKNNADVNSETDDEICPIHLAVLGDHIEVCQLLLMHDADIDAGNKHNQTPLHLAVTNSNLKLTRMLVKSGANCSVADARSETPFHLAAENGLHDIAEILLLGDSNLNVKDLKGKTPLDVAARGNYVTLVDMFLKAERFWQYLKSQSSNDVKQILTEVSFKPDKSPSTEQFRILLYRLASKLLKSIEWKQLAFYWGFTDRQLRAIEEQYTGSKSYREHGHRMLLIWHHGCLLKKQNPMKELYEGLLGIEKTDLAKQIRTKSAQTNDAKMCCMS